MSSVDSTSKRMTAVQRIADTLRAEILGLPVGEYLGSEESLSRRFSVSGPTLRQATRLLEHEELVTVRRGVRGGYYARRPDLNSISRIAATYLWGNIRSVTEIAEFVQVILPLAVDHIFASGRANEFQQFLDCREATSFEEFVDAQVRFVRLFWDLTGTAPLQLIGAIFLQVGIGARRDRDEIPPGMRVLEERRNQLVGTILKGDSKGSLIQARELHWHTHQEFVRNQPTFKEVIERSRGANSAASGAKEAGLLSLQ